MHSKMAHTANTSRVAEEREELDEREMRDEREMLKLKVRELEDQLEASRFQADVQTSMQRGEDCSSTPIPVGVGSRPTPQAPFYKVALPTYDGKDPSLYRDFDKRICTMIKRDRGADDDEKKYNLQISLTGYASDMIEEVVDSAEYRHMSF